MTEPTTFRLDKSIKTVAYLVFKAIRTKTTTSYNLFLSQEALIENIPFELKGKEPNATSVR